jgi:Golgi phosphoprotein 3 (GPP34)
MALNLAEEFLLLAYNDVSGKPMVDGMKLNAALAGTAVVELALTGALELTDRGRLVRTGQQPADSRLAVVAELADGRKPKDAISRISGLSGWHNRAGDLRPRLLPDADKRAIRRRGKEISESDWGAAAVRKAVQEVQTVMVAIIVTTTVAASAASS